ncbi:SMP-30/gluconolactonase/LRE family protein [Sphingomonas nostoxanthinifaciens]|uniref:SMP-30/gluconolactonase/LRE family protein n=1 Tax=Sphingomonas nostoxanthinifaciens TaxID=2872652 RepID=UPI001CC1C69B|nr:SMP-30/gluconolactonase/LRE family protein [Sphingomonas nostoxanthinifaciens]
MTIEVIDVLTLGATLGEGPMWSAAENALWFVDIKQFRLHRFDPDTQALRTWTAPEQPGWILPADGGGLAVGMQSGIHRFDPKTGQFDFVAHPEAHLPGNRFNDATVDPTGAIWFGTMHDAEGEASGRFYRHRDGETVDAGITPITITNGPAVSPDGATLYHVDTLGNTIQASAINDDGTLGPARPFAMIEDGAGHPDGPTVDAEGHVWIGLFGGWAVRRYDPAGQLALTVPFPVANITKIAFGGDGLRTAYATTARLGLEPDALAAQPMAGDLFAFEPGVAGLTLPAARI